MSVHDTVRILVGSLRIANERPRRMIPLLLMWLDPEYWWQPVVAIAILCAVNGGRDGD